MTLLSVCKHAVPPVPEALLAFLAREGAITDELREDARLAVLRRVPVQVGQSFPSGKMFDSPRASFHHVQRC